jgi:hypothetical protein
MTLKRMPEPRPSGRPVLGRGIPHWLVAGLIPVIHPARNKRNHPLRASSAARLSSFCLSPQSNLKGVQAAGWGRWDCCVLPVSILPSSCVHGTVLFHGLTPPFAMKGFLLHNMVIVGAARQPALLFAPQITEPVFGMGQLYGEAIPNRFSIGTRADRP